jgi:hypothetical protein
MPLRSRLLAPDRRLLDASLHPATHIQLKHPRERGAHVHKIQQALFRLGFKIDKHETDVSDNGPPTAKAVLAYKSDPITLSA